MPFSRLLIATKNADKIIEIRDLLADIPVEIITMHDISDLPDVDEDQPTLEGNAIKKATAFFQATGLPSLADDTGLEVDALDGAPGVHSARFAGARATYTENVDKLLSDMKTIPQMQRTAQFRTVMALATADAVETVDGECKGEILQARRGEHGFGYDPVFFVPEENMTFAEMPLEIKNQISHRGLALLKIKDLLASKIGA